MKKARKHKLLQLMSITVLLAGATSLVLYALRQNISLFYTPTQIAAGEVEFGRRIRVGGMVVKHSIRHGANDLSVVFQITDYKHTVEVAYQGILPDLFREEQGVVVLGELSRDRKFVANEVLAKHDENYMPPEVRDSLSVTAAS